MKVPLACALDSGEARAQLGEWEVILANGVDASDRPSANRLELRLSPDIDIQSVVRLAQRETSCCPFFAFALDIRADRLILVIEVADGAIEMLDQLFSPSTGG